MLPLGCGHRKSLNSTWQNPYITLRWLHSLASAITKLASFIVLRFVAVYFVIS